MTDNSKQTLDVLRKMTPVMADLTGVSSGRAVILTRTFSVAPDRILTPLSECDSWLNSVLAELQGSVTVPLPIPPEKEALIRMHIRDWDTVLHALYREELDPRHKVPAPKAVQEAIKPWVTFLRKMFYLCERIHTLQDDLPDPLPYSNARRFFLAVVWEMRYWDISWHLHHDEQSSSEQSHKRLSRISGKPYTKGRKEVISSDNFQVRDMFKDEKNLFDPRSQPHEFTMIESALILARKYPTRFRKEYWVPFYKAYANWAREIDRNGTYFVPVEQDGKIMRQGEGKYLETVL